MSTAERMAPGFPGAVAVAPAGRMDAAAPAASMEVADRNRSATGGGRKSLLTRRWAFLVGCGTLGYGLWWSPDFKTVAAGVAIFLFGMLFLEEGFTAFTGGILERILRRATKGLVRSHLFGIATTSVMQSSSLVSVITISFLSAGLIGLAEGVGIIFGANIGTTTGAWLMAAFGMKVKISAYAMPMLVFGLILTFQKRQDLQGAGRILAGLGFLFLGIHYMKEGFEAVGSSFDLSQYALTGFQGLFTYAGLGVLATVVMQSSHATLLLTIAALASGQVTYENALALAIGANIGTTITAIIGSLSAKIAGKRLALAHLVFNTVTALLAIVFIGPFRWCVDQVAALAGVAADDWTLKLAIFHTLFNLVGVAVMIPVIQPLVRFLESRVQPGGAEASCLEPQHLNDTALQHPDTALEALRQETAHLFDNTFEILAHGLNLHRHDILSRRDLDEVVASSTAKMEVDVMDGYYGSIKVLYNEIVHFASRARTETRLSGKQTAEVSSLLMVCRHVAEIVKDADRMRTNVNRHTGSADEHMRRQYDAVRRRVAEVLRAIFEIRRGEVQVSLALQRLKEHAQRDDDAVDGTVANLVYRRLMTSEMATSLMNDSHVAHEIVRRLIEIAERLFVAAEDDLERPGIDLLRHESRSLGDHLNLAAEIG